ncbi:MAG: hypothetical protein ACJ790_10555 [Myxococcaceae bacterium]
MKVLCVSCDRLAEMGSYRVDAGVLVITCARCGAEMRAVDAPAQSVHAAMEPGAGMASPSPKLVVLRRVEDDPAQQAAIAANVADPFTAPEGRCPKCIAPKRPDASTCHQCGLTFVNFVPSEVKPPAPIDKLWRDLLSKWDDSQAHDRIIAAAVSQSALPSIGRLYQIRCAVSPDDPQARRGRDEVVRLAMASASASALIQTPAMGARRGAKFALIMGAVFVFVMIFSLLLRQLFRVGG